MPTNLRGRSVVLPFAGYVGGSGSLDPRHVAPVFPVNAELAGYDNLRITGLCAEIDTTWYPDLGTTHNLNIADSPATWSLWIRKMDAADALLSEDGTEERFGNRGNLGMRKYTFLNGMVQPVNGQILKGQVPTIVVQPDIVCSHRYYSVRIVLFVELSD